MLGKHIFATLVYYDVMDYPLTSFEVWKHLLVLEDEKTQRLPSLAEVVKMLRELVQKKRLILFRGLYALAGREDLIQGRIQGEKSSVQKLKRTYRLITLLQWVPYLRMIAITGSLSMKKAEEGSDWDFFVVFEKGKIWLGRTFLTGVLHLLGKRRHGKYRENRACLNYFITNEDLSITPKDIFAAHEYRFLLPIFDRNTFRSFEFSNIWMKRFKPTFLPTEIFPRWTIISESSLSLFFQKFFERLFGSPCLEEWLASWQRKKIERNPKTKLSGSFIQTSAQALIFLPEPKGPKIFERFKTRLSEVQTLPL